MYLQPSTIRLRRKALKDEIKPLEAAAVAYKNIPMVVQIQYGFTCIGERDKESRNSQKKEAIIFLLVEKSLKIYCELTTGRPCAEIKYEVRSVAGPALPEQPVMRGPVM